MKKLLIDVEHLNDWMADNWNLYASQSIPYGKTKTRSLRLLINGNGWFKVTCGNDICYEGTQMKYAIAAWDSA